MPTTDKPKVNFNLDSLDNEGRPEPFSFVVGGRRYVTVDPTEVDWQTVVDLDTDDTRALLRVFLPPEDYTAFAAQKIPQYKVIALMTKINTHYGLLADPGEDVAS